MSAVSRWVLCWTVCCLVPTGLSVWLKPDTVSAYLTGLCLAGAVWALWEIRR